MIQARTELVEVLRSKGLPLIAAELGVAEGRFSYDLLSAGIENLYLVDKWKTTEGQRGDGGFPQEWHEQNLSEIEVRLIDFKGKYTVLRGDTVEMSEHVLDNSLSMIYLDADHSYEGVLRDLTAWYPKVVSGGIIAGHDFLSPDYGVKQAIYNFCEQNDYQLTDVQVIPENGIWDASFYFIKK